MDSWQRLMLCLVLVAATGCRAGRITEPLEHENRHLEDVIYELEDQLHELQAQLDSTQRENDALRNQDGTLRPSPAASKRSTPFDVSPPRAELGEPTDELPSFKRDAEDLEAAPPFQAPPLISPPSADRPDGVLPEELREEIIIEPNDQTSSRDAAPDESGRVAPVAFDAAAEPINSTGAITHITLNRQLTGGHDRDQHPGDEGIMVVVEPRDASNRIVNAAGKLAIAVVDPALTGPGARIARWDFTAEDSRARFKKTLLGEGIHLAMPWPGKPPAHEQLTLYVRLTLEDGKQLIVDRPIRVKRHVQPTAGGPGEEGPVLIDASAAANQWKQSARSMAGSSSPEGAKQAVRQASANLPAEPRSRPGFSRPPR